MNIRLVLFAGLLVLAFLGSKASSSKIEVNGKPLTCHNDAYNCPSYQGPHQFKRLKSCYDVKIVWETCQDDPHGLDADKDGKPCERDCKL